MTDHPFEFLTIPPGVDARGVPTRACPSCGCEQFYAVIWLDEAYVVAGYITDGVCAACGDMVTIATEIDHPDYERNAT